MSVAGAARTVAMTTSPSPSPVPFRAPGFAERLESIEERSAVLRTAALNAPADARVPGCPDWTTRDLLRHLSEVQRFWAATVAAGPATHPPTEPAHADPDRPDNQDSADHPDHPDSANGPHGSYGPEGRNHPDTPGGRPDLVLLAEQSARSTRLLLDALHAAGPDAECWTWWAETGNPATSGAVARHHLQEVVVLARDAQAAAGTPLPVPSDLALDAVDEFLHIGLGSTDGWPHAPARVALVSDEGPAWTLVLDATGASAVRVGPGEGLEPGAVVAGPAGDLLLTLFRRVPWGARALRVSGDEELVRQLVVWQPFD
jgi:uncharacterized protein (TIGR03083 family)